MNRKGHEDVVFFYGNEVEKTPAFGLKTLFVVGVPSTIDIAKHINGCEHIFFGSNHSYNPTSIAEYEQWENMIGHFLKLGYLCSLDIPITHVEEFNDSGLNEYNNFIPQIRISLPYLRLWNYNTMIKIDDRDFDATNPGVWTHSLYSLMSRESFTDWREYAKDSVV